MAIASDLKAKYHRLASQIQTKLESVLGSTFDPSGRSYAAERLAGILVPTIEECFGGLLSLVEAIYGKGSTQYLHLGDIRQRSLGKVDRPPLPFDYEKLRDTLIGFDRNLINEIENDLIPSLFRIAAGSTLSEFLFAAKVALDDGHKDVAAVLASAAYEDSLRQKAVELGLDVDKKDVESTINALKSAGFFQGPEAKAAENHIRLRNSAMHANWEKVDSTAVGSMIGFVEQFLLKHYT